MSKNEISPWTILNEMFHSDYFSERDEESACCPKCDECFEEHYYLLDHIENKHPEYLRRYISDLDNMLYNPLEFFSLAEHEGLIACVWCGNKFTSEGSFNRHMKHDHKKDIERFKEEMGGIE